ncbi:MAG: DUF1080 domain-containing protein [Bacteroidales bacterium]|nr:DUF1080 domain-containing protein [Bacteroidales bacterium]
MLARLALFTVAVTLVSFPALADDFTPEAGFVSLFNGKDLSGWQYKKRVGKGKFEIEKLEAKTATADGRFVVKDGTIVAMAKDKDGKGGIQDLFTVAEFNKDFTLRLDVKAGLKADSGVYVRGPQLQVRDYKRRGEQKQMTKFQDDGWNALEIVVSGGKPSYTLNGEAITGGPPKIPAIGGIGLQAETGPFEFRHIRIRVAQ